MYSYLLIIQRQLVPFNSSPKSTPSSSLTIIMIVSTSPPSNPSSSPPPSPLPNYYCLDWWHNRDVTVQLPAAPSTSESESTISTTPPTVSTTFHLHCTPAQHWGNHHLFDRWTALWGLWAVESNPLNPTTSQPMNRPMENKKLWFGSNTGFRSMHDGEDEDELPVCPVFKEIGVKFGVFNLGLIPIQVDT
ncbi:hypothetical protein M422DRAFT_245485 [Sphaerobolus stellatus SS14]|nr:hypothetical protein M422DRAFT_245485 [Sphaerobolus stellatus SS14]